MIAAPDMKDHDPVSSSDETGRSLLMAILDRPKDWYAKMVYADYLEDIRSRPSTILAYRWAAKHKRHPKLVESRYGELRRNYYWMTALGNYFTPRSPYKLPRWLTIAMWTGHGSPSVNQYYSYPNGGTIVGLDYAFYALGEGLELVRKQLSV